MQVAYCRPPVDVEVLAINTHCCWPPLLCKPSSALAQRRQNGTSKCVGRCSLLHADACAHGRHTAQCLHPAPFKLHCEGRWQEIRSKSKRLRAAPSLEWQRLHWRVDDTCIGVWRLFDCRRLFEDG